MMYEQQMNMFQEGGIMLKDEGGEVESTSGNDVPLGGIKEGVADDQEANLSAGEIIIPQDVAAWYGAKFFMDLRDEAKMGYRKMEAMGQLGNADEATIPTDAIFNSGGAPFSVVDLEYIDMDDNVDESEIMSMVDNDDKPIEAQAGTLVPVQQPAASFSRINPTTGLPEITSAPATSLPQVLQPGTTSPITTGSALTPTTLSRITPTSTPISQPDKPASQQPTAPTTPLPPLGQFLGGVQGTNFFINEIGQVIQIPVINGKQLFDEPEGFQPYDPSNPTPFDPDQEEDDITTDEQPQQRRTVTEREEGGQPDVGSPYGGPTGSGTGFDVPDTSFADDLDEGAKGLNAAFSMPAETTTEIDARNTAINDAIALGAMNMNISAAEYASRLEERNWGLISFGSIAGIASKLGFDLNTISKEDLDAVKQRAVDIDRISRKASKPPTGSQGRDTLGVRGDPTQFGSAGAGFATPSPAPSPDTADTGTESPAGGGLGSMSSGDVGSLGIAKGGLISPRLHRKRMKKNNRKGLAAPK
jgi:hypothetical protein